MILEALRFIAQTILDEAEDELYNEETVHREMSEAHALLESGAITEEEFDRREQSMMERLEKIEARRRAHQGDDAEDADDEDTEDEEGKAS